MPRDYLFIPPHTAFILNHAAALRSAAQLLGGDAAESRLKHLVDGISLGSPMTSRLNRELDALEDLLALRHVHDPERIEAELFSTIDPASPVVEELCLLLDGLRNARRQAAVAAA